MSREAQQVHKRLGGPVKPLAAMESYRGQDVIVKLSFGKDSLATLLAMLDAGIHVVKAIECDTGWEALEHYEYVAKMRPLISEKYGVDIITLRADVNLQPERIHMAEDVERIMGIYEYGVPFSPFVRRTLYKGMFSSRMRKWCTHDLKIKPSLIWLANFLEASDDNMYVVTGIRADESLARANMPPFETWDNELGLSEWRPLLHWSVQDVVAQLTRHGIPTHPMYQKGATRVGCWPCIQCGKADFRILGSDERRVAAITALEGYTQICSPAIKRGGKGPLGMFFDSSPDDSGTFNLVPITTKIAWAQTSRGVSTAQQRMFEIAPPSACTRWGWCEPFEA